MSEELNLAKDLAVILVSAGLITIVAKALKQPLVLGYIIAGLLIGPHISFFPGIESQETVTQWSDIGIIFLMFGLGLEFSFKKLLKVGASAIVTAAVKFAGVFILGFVTAQAMSWSLMESVFLGGLLSMSSTMVVIKSFDDMGLKNKPFAGAVFGTLVVEDLIAILLMVLLSTMAISKSFAGGELVGNILKLLFFLVLWFLVGIFLIPTLLKKAKRFLSDEILMIVSLGLCFGMVTIATSVGFSSALGAFVMGSILAETTEGEHIVHLVEPIKNLFGAVFFISVGMMVDPAVIAEHWVMILLLSLIVIVSHIIFVAAGMIMTGKSLDDAVHAGFSLAQLGEFGFILAGVGCTLGVMREFIYPVIIAVSVITTFTTPYMIKLGTPCNNLLYSRIPKKWLDKLSGSKDGAPANAVEDNEWKKLLKAYFLRIVLYGVIIVAIYIGTTLKLGVVVEAIVPGLSENAVKIVEVVLTLALMSPFLYGLGQGKSTLMASAPKLVNLKRSNRWPLLGLLVLRAFISPAIVIAVISTYFHMAGWAVILVLVAGVYFFFHARNSMLKFDRFEQTFLSNYNELEISERKNRPVASSVNQKLSSYNVFTELVTVSADSSWIGYQLKEIPLREQTGANIIKLTRGSNSMIIPSGEIVIYPGDSLLAVGNRDQLTALKDMLAGSTFSESTSCPEPFGIESVALEGSSFLTGKSLRSLSLRKYKCMIICVIRGAECITNPDPDFCFREGDTVWVAGDLSLLGWI